MSAASRPLRADDPIATAEQMRAVDRAAIEDWGVPAAVLMENAGRACAERLERLADTGAFAREVLVLCGPGNNGGDGLVVARTLAARGFGTSTWFAGSIEPRSRSSTETRLELELVERVLGLPRELAGESDFAAFESALRSARSADAVVVDAVFGTGLAREVAGVQRRALELVAASGATVFAIDVPSGLDADNGEVLGFACPARFTTVLAATKRGLHVGRGPALAGELELAEIGIPRPLLDALPRCGVSRAGRVP